MLPSGITSAPGSEWRAMVVHLRNHLVWLLSAPSTRASFYVRPSATDKRRQVFQGLPSCSQACALRAASER